MRFSSFHEIEALPMGQVPSEQCSEQRGDSQLKHRMTIPLRTIAARAGTTADDTSASRRAAGADSGGVSM